jgi:hypothetical protein
VLTLAVLTIAEEIKCVKWICANCLTVVIGCFAGLKGELTRVWVTIGAPIRRALTATQISRKALCDHSCAEKVTSASNLSTES